MQAVGRPPQRAPDGAPPHYERHRPEQTTLYRIVQQHAAGFIAHAEASTGAELPRCGGSNGYRVSGGTLTAKMSGSKAMIMDEKGGAATVTIADVVQSNGVIHVIDKVLLPK